MAKSDGNFMYCLHYNLVVGQKKPTGPLSQACGKWQGRIYITGYVFVTNDHSTDIKLDREGRVNRKKGESLE